MKNIFEIFAKISIVTRIKKQIIRVSKDSNFFLLRFLLSDGFEISFQLFFTFIYLLFDKQFCIFFHKSKLTIVKRDKLQLNDDLSDANGVGTSLMSTGRIILGSS